MVLETWITLFQWLCCPAPILHLSFPEGKKNPHKEVKNHLSSALDSMRIEYNLNSNQCERILNRFDELGIGPITLRNNSQFESLLSLISILQKNQHAIPKRDDDGFIILEWKKGIPKK